MRKGITGLLMVLCSGALLLGGCAKEQTVKKDQSAISAVAPETPTAPTPPSTPSAPSPIETPITTAPIKESPIASVKEETLPMAKPAEAQLALEKVFFDFDSFVLKQDARDILAKNAELLKKNSAVSVKIEGHCDERGSDEYNLALGEKRARSAMSYLVTLGVKADKLSIISYGKEKPAVAGHDEAAWSKNRRAEFVVVQ